LLVSTWNGIQTKHKLILFYIRKFIHNVILLYIKKLIKYKAKKFEENIISPHPLTLWITITIVIHCVIFFLLHFDHFFHLIIEFFLI
jgi:hypothetical protein